ncbi:hypothetical protein BJ138DRAFT_1163516 [Hygrophoropsis aurantiaca]|uniref:Uncharacterized protein n=1 Tax=Hygrophoropsis aurantiaca TaxID=72124 RepID=A0ACB8A0F1_9AGAM|nr:hypothetical protein BJ138DRAFT_1163516 [Hygrophoropsis aurantiaca]
MKFEAQQINTDDVAFADLTTQRNLAIAESAKLRNQLVLDREAHHAREAELILEKTRLQNENDVLRAQLSDSKRQVRLLEQRKSQKTPSRKSSAPVVDLCTPEPENHGAEEMLIPNQPETKQIPLKRKHSDAGFTLALQSGSPGSLSLPSDDSEKWRPDLKHETPEKKIKVDSEDAKPEVKAADLHEDHQEVFAEAMDDVIPQEIDPNDTDWSDSDEPGVGEEMNVRSPATPLSSEGSSRLPQPDQSLPNDAAQLVQRSISLSSRFPTKNEEKLVLSPDVAADHLRNCPPFQTQYTDQQPGVSRKFLTTIYGCTGQALFGIMKEKGSKDRPVVIPSWDLNPLLPAAPGLPGVMLSLRKEFFRHPSLRLFVCVATNPVLWRYHGEYKFAESGVLSPTEFTNQASTVKRTWANKISNDDKTGHAVYRELRARIYLRKSGKSLTAGAVKLESQRIKKKTGGRITSNDVINALSSGDESISIVTMTCIDFDHRFADRIAHKWWVFE